MRAILMSVLVSFVVLTACNQSGPVESNQPGTNSDQPAVDDSVVEPAEAVEPYIVSVCYDTLDVRAHLIKAELRYRYDDMTYETVVSSETSGNCVIFDVDMARVAEGFQFTPHPFDLMPDGTVFDHDWYEEKPTAFLGRRELTVDPVIGQDLVPGDSWFFGQMSCDKEMLFTHRGSCWQFGGHGYLELIDCVCGEINDVPVVKCRFISRERDDETMVEEYDLEFASHGCMIHECDGVQCSNRQYTCVQGECDYSQPL